MRSRFDQRSSCSALSLYLSSAFGMSLSMTCLASAHFPCGMSFQTSFEVKESSGASRRIIASSIMYIVVCALRLERLSAPSQYSLSLMTSR